MRRNENVAVILKTVSAAIHNADCSGIAVQTEMNALIQTASEQKILPLVVEALHGTAEGLDGFAEAKRMAKRLVMAQVLRSERFLLVYDRLFSAGVTPLVVKGILCRSVYPKGDLRPSADEDIYVGEAQFEKSCAVLRELGMTCDEKADAERDCDVGWCSADGILHVELHRTLFATDSAATAALQGFFDDAFSHPREYEVVPGRVVLSLNEHEHLLYLILHAYKHFIHSGFGIRQVCDIGLWAQRYADCVDWARLREQTQAVRADRFAAAVFRIAREELGIDLPQAPLAADDTVDAQPLLHDLLCGGVYGTADANRRHSASVTLHAVESERGGRRGGLVRTLFPPKAYLLRDYPELAAHPLRLPWVWCKRLCRYRAETARKDRDSARDALRISRERKKLLQYYNII